jgi:hypothetical protein
LSDPWASSIRHRARLKQADEYKARTSSPITGRLNPVAILKAIRCYEYQSCEHTGWETSEARLFCGAFRSRMIRMVSGYTTAAREIIDSSEAVTGVQRSTARSSHLRDSAGEGLLTTCLPR